MTAGPDWDPMLPLSGETVSCLGGTALCTECVYGVAPQGHEQLRAQEAAGHGQGRSPGSMNRQEGWLANKRMHLTVGRPAVANVGSCWHPPAGDAQR